MNHPFLICVVGPTAIGKTKLAIALAQHFNCDIISADSRQFYKEMTIGTAVPTVEEFQAAPHHFIQNKSIHQPYTVGDFEVEGLHLLNTLFHKNKIQILVGGSGLYVNAILNGFDYFPAISTDIRESINQRYQQFGIAFLIDELLKRDAYYYHYLSINNPQTLKNPQRLKRFVEVCIATNQPYSSFLNKTANNRNFIPIIIGLEANRDVLYQQINLRVDNMMANGLLQEVENLLPYQELNALKTVGYQELFDFLNHKISLEEAIDNIKQNTRNFAKRQLTWFKRNQNTHWFNHQTALRIIIECIDKNINAI